MNVSTIHNKKQLEEYIAYLREGRLPKKVADQDIYPLRSLESNAYYWGIVLKHISDATGHTELQCHEEFKKMFLFKYDVKYIINQNRYEWTAGVWSTTKIDNREIWEYIMKIRVFAETELRIVIPLPNECFINELDFEHDNIETRRL